MSGVRGGRLRVFVLKALGVQQVLCVGCGCFESRCYQQNIQKKHGTQHQNNHFGNPNQTPHPLNPKPLNEKIQDTNSEKVLPTSANPRLLDRIGYSWSSTKRMNCNSTQQKTEKRHRFIFFVAGFISRKTRRLSVLSGEIRYYPPKSVRCTHSATKSVWQSIVIGSIIATAQGVRNTSPKP